VEIGPGKGILTRELLKEGPVIAIEKDEILLAGLQETFAQDIAAGRLRLLTGDVRDFDPTELGAYVVAANIPYYITGEIIRQFLTAKCQPRAMALLVQKEVARRIVSPKESLLSLSVKAYGSPRIAGKVSRTHFSPPPSVDSAIIVVDNISKQFFDGLPEEQFFTLLHTGFAQKRKMLIGNLSSRYDRALLLTLFTACGIDEKARAEEVLLAQWAYLAKRLLGGS
jgi:16S rRNA (adenine1518-N6/adenine1519-N6)-dimethyltransferase